MGDGCTIRVGWIAVIVVGNNNQREELRNQMAPDDICCRRCPLGPIKRAHHPGDENTICLFLATVRSGYSSTRLLIYKHSTVTARLASIPYPRCAYHTCSPQPSSSQHSSPKLPQHPQTSMMTFNYGSSQRTISRLVSLKEYGM